MEMREFIQKYFVPALKENKDTGNVELNIYQSVWDHPVRIPDSDEDIFIHCGKGHVLKTDINGVSDIVDKGCPFCKKSINERYIHYMTTYESLGFVIEMLPKTLGQYKNVKCHLISENKENYCVVNPWLINVNTINKNRNHWNFIVFDRKKRDVTNEICNLAEELWLRAFGNNLYDHNIMLLPTYRNIEELTRIKLVPKDFILMRCNKCGKIHLISACRLAAMDVYCMECGQTILNRKQAWFGGNIHETSDGDIDLMWIPRVDTVTTLLKLRKHVRTEGINIDGIKDCSSQL